MRRTVRALFAVGTAATLTLGSLSLAQAAFASEATIVSDQPDYAPGSDVELTAAGWGAGDTVHVTVDDVQGQSWKWQGDATADDGGGFAVHLTLPTWFVADYLVVADNGAGTTARTTFTDSNVQVGAVSGATRIAAGIVWTTYRKNATCTGTTLNTNKVTTDTGGNGLKGTSGVGNTTAMGLVADSPVVFGGRVYTFDHWSEDISGNSATTCVPGDTLNGKITAIANYTDAGPATKTAQSITFAALADKTFGDADFTVAATATSGLPVTFSVVAPSVCTVSGSTVHLTGVGDCTIQADQAGNATYYAAPPVARSFSVLPGGTVVTVSCPASQVYTSVAIEPCTATATGSGLNQSVPVTYTNNVNVGTATASASYAGDATHAAGSGSATFAISAAGTSVSITCPTSVVYSGSVQTPCTALATGPGLSQSVTPTYTSNTNVGTANVSASYGGDANHSSSSNSTTFGITQAGSDVTVTCPATATYTGSALTPCSALVTGVGGLSQSLTPTYTSNTAVGTASASATFAGDTNHTGDTDGATFQITAAGSTVTITCPGSVTYTGSALTPCTAKATGAGGLDQNLTVTYSDNTDAGTATASASFAGDASHTASNNSTTFTIDKAASVTTISCSSPVTYSGIAQTPCSAVATGAGGLNAPVDVTYTSNTNAGTGNASATYTGDDNHLGSSDTDTFTISKAASGIVFDCPTSVDYDGSAQTPCTATATGAGGLSTPVIVTYSTDHTNAGTVTASASYAGDANHESSSDSTTFEILKAASSTVVTCPASVEYTGSARTPCTAAVTGPGGLSLSPTPSYSSNTNVGQATASYSYAGDANHESSSDTKHFDITKAGSTTTITCTLPVTYTGSAIEPCTATATGAGGLSESVTVVYTDNTDAGTAGASATYAGDPNHDGSNDSETFTIDKAGSTTTVTCTSPQTYTGSAISACSATATGVGGLSAPVAVTYTNNTNAGTAGASATYDGDDNHNGSTGTGSFTIGKAGSTTSVSCPSAVGYTGSARTPCTASASGAGMGSAVPLTVTYTDNTNAGTAGASAGWTGDNNHDSSSDSTTFEISQASSVVTVTCPTTRTYTGSAIEPCTAKATGAGMSDLPLTVTYSTDHTNVGTVTASASWAGDANHTGNSGTGSFDITKAVLTVTADNKARQYSDPDPAFTYAITGFVGGQTLATSGVTGTPTCGTVAVFDSPSVPGGYAINCLAGSLSSSNYDFSFAPGTLTVNKEDAVVDYPGSTFVVTPGATDTSMNVTVTGFLKEAQDGSLGARLTSQTLSFSAQPTSGSPVTCTTGNLTVTAPGVASGTCTLTNVPVDSLTLELSLPTNGYYAANVEDFVLTVTNPGTGFMTGGGWITDPSSGLRDNFGFNVKSAKKGLSGSSLFIYRRVLTAPETINGITVPAGAYNWIIKSNAMSTLSMSCNNATPKVCIGSFTGKATLKAVNRTTGVAYGIGGNQAFQIDVTDNGEPGASSSTTPDTYGLKVSNSTNGTYYSTGTGAAITQIALKGGNIQVRP
jgi:hypothetical protein